MIKLLNLTLLQNIEYYVYNNSVDLHNPIESIDQVLLKLNSVLSYRIICREACFMINGFLSKKNLTILSSFVGFSLIECNNREMLKTLENKLKISPGVNFRLCLIEKGKYGFAQLQDFKYQDLMALTGEIINKYNTNVAFKNNIRFFLRIIIDDDAFDFFNKPISFIYQILVPK